MSEDNSTTVMGLSGKLADFTVSVTLDSTPPKAVENAKITILDCFGVAVLGASQEIGEVLLKFARKNRAPGSCSIWGTAMSASARDAALFNGTLAHGLDYDDRNHASTYTLAASIALAEDLQCSGAKTLEAYIAGREVRAALDGLFSKRSSGVGPGAKGWHSNGILGPIAAACSASKILDLDSQQVVVAIGLAAGSCGALTRDGGTMAKPFRVGHAAMTGINCALLAREGFTADETSLEGRYGLLEALGPLPDDVLDALGKSLGGQFDLERRIRVKPYASCTATHSGLEAMLRLVQKHGIAPRDVEAIECDLKPYPLVRQRPTRGFEGRFSMPFCLAVALIYGKLKPSDFTNERLCEPLVQELIGRTRHVSESSALSVRLKNRTTLTEAIQRATDLQSWDQICDKFDDSAASVLSNEKRAAVVASVNRLEELPEIKQLTRNLRTDA
jgi:2-methylcitrate dehydratase PrpD